MTPTFKLSELSKDFLVPGQVHLKRPGLGFLNNGLTREKIQEIVLQAASYYGIPAGLECTRLAVDAFAELYRGIGVIALDLPRLAPQDPKSY